MPAVPEIATILDQPFAPLARGCNVRVYASADGNYVLKTWTTPADIIEWFASDGLAVTDLPWAPALAPPGADVPTIIDTIQARAVASYRLAAEHLAAETGLVHLQCPDDPPKTTPFPAVSIDNQTFDATAEPFILQHRAALVRHRLSGATQDQGRAIIDAVVGLIRHFWTQGIADDTLNFHNNMGFLGNRLVQVDIGEFSHSRDTIRDHAATNKILNKKSFAWLTREHPDLADYMRDQVTRHLSPTQVEALWLT